MHSQLIDAHVSAPDLRAALTAIAERRLHPLAGVSPRGVPKILAAWLEAEEGTATSLLEYLSGEKLRLQVIRPAPGEPPAKRKLTDKEQFRLGAGGLASCNWRHAVLRASGSGMIAAAVSLTWLPVRLPWDTCAQLDAGREPAGVILNRLPGGVHRQDQMACPAWTLEEITGATAAVTSSAVLEVDGCGRVAIAEEWVLREFAESLAGRDPGRPPAVT